MGSTTLNERLFMARTFRNPIDHSVGASFSKVGFNSFVIPHPKVHNMDTKFRRFSKEEMFKINFAPQNVMLNQENEIEFNPEAVSPPRMNFEYEDQIPIPFSPIMSPISSTDEETEGDELEYERVFGNNFSQEYLEPSLPEHLLIHQSNPQTQQPQYNELFLETKYSYYQDCTLNEVQPSQQNDEECDSENLYAALYKESLDEISEDENSVLKREEGELSPTPPREMAK